MSYSFEKIAIQQLNKENKKLLAYLYNALVLLEEEWNVDHITDELLSELGMTQSDYDRIMLGRAK